MPPNTSTPVTNNVPKGIGDLYITRLSEMPLEDAIIMLLFGASGSGKTHFVGTAAACGKLAILNIGGGMATLKSPNFRKKYPEANDALIITITEESNPKKATGYDECQKAIEYLFNTKLDEFDTLAVDDMTALRRFAMSKALELGSTAGTSNTRTKFMGQDIAGAAVQDFGMEMKLTESFLIDLIALCRETNKNLICTAHERIRYKKNDKGNDTDIVDKIMPGFTGKTFPDAVTGHFDLNFYVEPIGTGETIKRRFRTVGSASLTATAKWSGVFKPVEDDIDFPTIQRRIKESLNK